VVTARLRQLELSHMSDVRCVPNACDCEGGRLLSPSDISDGFDSSIGIGGLLPRSACVAAFHSCDAHLMKRLLPEMPAAVGSSHMEFMNTANHESVSKTVTRRKEI
jgi:hypothetical protein